MEDDNAENLCAFVVHDIVRIVNEFQLCVDPLGGDAMPNWIR